MKTIDLNADLGEGMPWDFELLKRVTSASVSCGAHAGTDDEIRATLNEAKQRGVAVGARPSWSDREGFVQTFDTAEWLRSFNLSESLKYSDMLALMLGLPKMIIKQITHLNSLAWEIGLNLWYIKPHGVLYSQTDAYDPEDIVVGVSVCSAAAELGLPIMSLPHGPFERSAAASHVSIIREAFPDRRYDKIGCLSPCDRPADLIHDRAECVEQALKLIDSGVESLCPHGDSPTAVEFADALLERFAREEIVVRSFIDRG